MKDRSQILEPMRIGGQAVIEGVMMRAPGMVATALRRADGSIVVQKEEFISATESSPLLGLPVLRGAVGLVEMLIVGVRSLNFSAAVAMEDARAGGNGHEPANGNDTPFASSNVGTALTVVIALLAGIAIFFAGPLYLATSLFHIEQNPLLFNLCTGAIRVVFLLAYLGGISMIREIRRLFEYHGAEHKAVFAFERERGLSVDAAMRQSRFHPRCGTSFLLIVMIAAIMAFALLDWGLILLLGTISLPIRLLTHLPLIPVVGGISFEFLRFSARHATTPLGRMIVAPGLWLQKITTREPDERQVEVALAALRAALKEEPVAAKAAVQPISAN